MSVTQDYNLTSCKTALSWVRQHLLDQRMTARARSDWNADSELSCAIRNIDSALIALGQVK
jgi:hypothetical protein